MKIISSMPTPVSKVLSIPSRRIRSLCTTCFKNPCSAVDRAADAALVTFLALASLAVIADELQRRRECQNPDQEELRLSRKVAIGYRFLRSFFSGL